MKFKTSSMPGEMKRVFTFELNDEDFKKIPIDVLKHLPENRETDYVSIKIFGLYLIADALEVIEEKEERMKKEKEK